MGTKLVAVHEVKVVEGLREPREEAYAPNVGEEEFCELHLEGSSDVGVCPGRSWKMTRATLRGVRLRSILLTTTPKG